MSPRERKTEWTAAAMILLVLLGVLVWGQTTGFGFVWDDNEFIVNNRAIRSITFLPKYFTDMSTMAGMDRANDFVVFRPLRNISYLFDFSVAGLNPWWWHAHNVLLHILNTLLLFFVARHLLRDSMSAFVAAAVFLLHPAQTEVVAWVKCRDDLLAVSFSLLCLHLWLRWRETTIRPHRLAMLGVVYLMACLSKVQAIALPALILALDYCVPPESGRERSEGETVRSRWLATLTTVGVLGVVALAFLVWRHVFIGRTSQTGYLSGDLGSTMLTMTRAGARYLWLLVWPRGLVADYSGMEASRTLMDPRVFGSIVLLLALAIVVVVNRRRWPVVTFGIVWVAVCFAPVSNIIPMMQYMAERYMYLPLAGFALTAGAVFLMAARRRKTIATCVVCVLLLALSVQTVVRARVWCDPLTLFEVTVRDTPPAAVRARRNLLALLINERRYEEALPLAQDLWTSCGHVESLAARRRAEYGHRLGVLLIHLGREEEGLSLMKEAIHIDPTHSEPYVDVGLVSAKAGDPDSALEWFRKGIAADPASSHAQYCAGVSLRDLGRMSEAESAFAAAVSGCPRTPDAHKSLAALLWSQGRLAEAVDLYSEAGKLWPADEEIQHWLSVGREKL